MGAAALLPMQLFAGEFGGSLAATTDYVFRGISQTRGAPAYQADVHYKTVSRSVFGLWASTVDFNARQGASFEADVYAGHEWNLSREWDARVGYTHYFYPDSTGWLSYNYDEVAATLTYESRFSATIAWSPNVSRRANGWVARNDTAVSYEFVASQPLGHRIAAFAGVGYYDLPAVLEADYLFWNAGVSVAIGRAQAALMYVDADAAAERAFGYEAAASSLSGSLSWRF
jgi:uncharacterized protein (TIGR02001 family)